VDQEASLNLPELTARLAELFREGRPEVVLTHPYEGGHPDHDATALAVNSAVEALKREKIPVPLLLEFTSYHAGKAGEMITGEFLPCEDRRETAIVLTGEARRRKREMIQCFVTQRDVLRHFPVVYERFRYAPAYDFTEPPHRGELFYERFNWGITGERWRDLARKALRSQARITL
jgi:LmbE family N-acetylglucosaminyl deacetylase